MHYGCCQTINSASVYSIAMVPSSESLIRNVLSLFLSGQGCSFGKV